MTAPVDSARNVLVRELPLEQIEPSDFNPRTQFDLAGLQELAESIKAFGLIEPIVVRTQRSLADGSPLDDAYEIIAGERRYRATMLAGLDTIPAMIREVDDVTALRMAITENLERRDLDPIEEARGYQLLTERAGMRQKAIAEVVNRSQPAVANAMRLLELPADVQERIRSGELSRAHGVALASLKDFPAVVSKLAELAVKERRTSKDLERPFRIYGLGATLVEAGLVRQIHRFQNPFDTSVCRECPFNAYRAGTEGWNSNWCLNPAHYDELATAAAAKQAAVLEAKIAALDVDAGVVLKLDELSYDQYERISSYAGVAGCSEECPCRQVAVNSSGSPVAICTDPKRMRRLRTVETKASKADARAQVKADLEQVTVHLDEIEELSVAEVVVLCAEILFRASKQTAVKAAATRHVGDALKDVEFYTWELRTRQDTLQRLAELAPAALLKLTVEAILRQELVEWVDGYGSTAILGWYLQHIGVEPPADGEVEA